MTYFVSFRASEVAGPMVEPRVCLAQPGSADLALVPDAAFADLVAGRDLLFATHGFNVTRSRGVRALGKLHESLGLDGASTLFLGVLWPGDSWIPVIDYPFEGSTAIHCGRRLGDFCNQRCAGAHSISFASHSLGARVVLEAVKGMDRRARLVCLMAGAVNRDCLATQYREAAGNAERFSVLASHCDQVLQVAFPIGDPIADLLHDDHTPFQPGIGYDGPPRTQPQPVVRPWQIADGEHYGHGDYLPPGDVAEAIVTGGAKWMRPAQFLRRAFLGEPQGWPG